MSARTEAILARKHHLYFFTNVKKVNHMKTLTITLLTNSWLVYYMKWAMSCGMFLSRPDVKIMPRDWDSFNCILLWWLMGIHKLGLFCSCGYDNHKKSYVGTSMDKVNVNSVNMESRLRQSLWLWRYTGLCSPWQWYHLCLPLQCWRVKQYKSIFHFPKQTWQGLKQSWQNDSQLS